MHEYGSIYINGKTYAAIRFTDTGIVHVFYSRRPTRVSRRIAANFIPTPVGV